MLYFEKNCEIIFFRSLTLVSENMPKIISIGPLHFGTFYFKNKETWHFKFLSIKYFVKRFLFLKIWNVQVNFCGNYGPSNLLFCFTGHNLEKLNKRQKEIAVNWLVHYFESWYQKECLVEASRFLNQWLFNDDSLKFL